MLFFAALTTKVKYGRTKISCSDRTFRFKALLQEGISPTPSSSGSHIGLLMDRCCAFLKVYRRIHRWAGHFSLGVTHRQWSSCLKVQSIFEMPDRCMEAEMRQLFALFFVSWNGLVQPVFYDTVSHVSTIQILRRTQNIYCMADGFLYGMISPSPFSNTPMLR